VLPPWTDWFGAEAIFDLLPDTEIRTRLIEETPRLPLRAFEEVLPDITGWSDARCAYVRLSETYLPEATQASEAGWHSVALAGNHLSIITQPATVAEAIVSATDHMTP
jgi:hypothetical protein